MNKLTSITAVLLAMFAGCSYLSPAQAADPVPATARKKTTAAGKKARVAKKKGTATSRKGAPKKDSASAEKKSGLTVPGKAWATPEKVQEVLGKKIVASVKSTGEADLKAFMKTPANRLMLAQWMLAEAILNTEKAATEYHTKSQKDLQKAETEFLKAKAAMDSGDKSPEAANKFKRASKRYESIKAEATTPKELAAVLKSASAAEMMTELANDLDWMEKVVYSGECERLGVVLSIMMKIQKEYPDMMEEEMALDIATATALEFARSGWLQDKAVERALYFIENQKKGRLNTVFDKLPFWQRRMVCGCKGDNDFGSVESLKWSLDNVHLPADQYGGSCWRCGYKLYNLFGESIHGAFYYSPFDDIYGDNKTGAACNVGGVCGSLSHFGAFSALAHGIPALTSGEPGHCSFIVLMGDKWTPCYSLTWERGCHWQAWKSVHVYSHLHMATECYEKENALKTAMSQAWRTLAGVLSETHPEQTIDSYARSVKSQPCNYAAWREYCEYLKSSEADTAAWKAFNKSVCTYMVPEYPEMGAELLSKHAYPAMAGKVGGPDMRECMLEFWGALEGMGPDKWRVNEMAQAQVTALALDKDAKEFSKYFGEVLGAVASKGDYMPLVMAWGNEAAEKLGGEAPGLFMAANVKALSEGSGLSKKDRDKVLAPAILAAESMMDIKAFQSLSKMSSGDWKKDVGQMPDVKAFSGKLVSEGGAVRLSSTSQYDRPCAHAGILTPSGGLFHTAKDKEAWVVVRLPRTSHLTGVAVVPTTGNLARLHGMKVQVSESGKDGDWQDVASLGQCDKPVLRADISGKRPRAQYVRILRSGEADFLHLRGVYVYGTPAS